MDESKDGIKALAVKYGAAMIALFLNHIFTYRLIWSVLSVAGLVPESGDGRLILLLLANEAASYILPLTLFHILFGESAKSANGLAGYEKFPLSVPLLFICGISAGAISSQITVYITEFVSFVFGVDKPPEAFGNSMPTNIATFTVFLLCTGVIAPVCEEILFRHYLLKPLRRYGDMTAAVVSSVIFGLYHANFNQLSYAVIVGFFLAVIAIRSSSIMPALIAHVINNLIVGLVNYLPESMDNALKAVANVLTYAVNIVIYAGVLLLLIKRGREALKLRGNCALSQKTQLKYFCSEPMVIGGLIVMATAFFI